MNLAGHTQVYEFLVAKSPADGPRIVGIPLSPFVTPANTDTSPPAVSTSLWQKFISVYPKPSFSPTVDETGSCNRVFFHLLLPPHAGAFLLSVQEELLCGLALPAHDSTAPAVAAPESMRMTQVKV